MDKKIETTMLKNSLEAARSCTNFLGSLISLEAEIKNLQLPADKKRLLDQLDNWINGVEVLGHKLLHHFAGAEDGAKWITEPYLLLRDKASSEHRFKVDNIFQYYRVTDCYTMSEIAAASEVPLLAVMLADFGIMFPSKHNLKKLQNVLDFPIELGKQLDSGHKSFSATIKAERKI